MLSSPLAGSSAAADPVSRPDAILLVGFGGPRGPADVLPFLRNVTRGRGVPPERLAAVAEHYQRFGGVSPINSQNSRLAEALAIELAQRGHRLPVVCGNRNWTPFLADVLRELAAAGHRSVLAVLTSPYSAYSACRQYQDDLSAALAEPGIGKRVRIDKLRQYSDLPGFAAGFASGLIVALDELQAADPTLTTDAIEVLFTGHSLPQSQADSSGWGACRTQPGGAYVAQHLAVARRVMVMVAHDLVGRTSRPSWQLVFQSRSGPAHQSWLGPDINEAIAELPAHGRRAVIVVPIGFISDHMEVLWDLDIEAAATAERLGLGFRRVPTPGVAEEFVAGLVDLIVERLAGGWQASHPRPGRLDPWFDPCPPGCCPRPVPGGRAGSRSER